MYEYLKWGAENYGSIIAFSGTGLSIFLFFRRWIFNAIRSINIGIKFHNVFGDKPVEKIKETHDKLSHEANKLSIRLDIHEKYLSIGLFICEPKEGRCIWTNDYLNSLFGLDSSDMHGYEWMSAIRQEDKEKVYNHWKFSIDHNTPYECEYSIINQRSKELKRVIATAVAAVDESGETVCYVGYITECK